MHFVKLGVDGVRHSPALSHFRDYQTFIYSVFKANWILFFFFCMALINIKAVLSRISLQVILIFFVLNVLG